MAVINVRLPLVEVMEGDVRYLVALVYGHPTTVEFGDEVKVITETDSFESLFVGGIDAVLITDLVPEVLALLDVNHAADLRTRLERAYGTGMPIHAPVTLYTLYDGPVEESVGDEDEL